MPRRPPDEATARDIRDRPRDTPVANAAQEDAAGATVYTIGHSTREWRDFVALLQRHGIERLVDVRTFPGSRRYPHFDRERMAPALASAGMAYEHAPALGGRRRARPDAPKTGWRNAGFAGYADHMTGTDFKEALGELIASSAARRTTVMCSEAVHWRCHRALLSDALLARGINVQHIMDGGLRPHALTSFARVTGTEVRYDADDPQFALLEEA